MRPGNKAEVRTVGVRTTSDIASARPYLDGDREWSALVDASPAGVLLLHGDGRLVRANTAACELLGLDANRLLVAYTSDYLGLAARLPVAGHSILEAIEGGHHLHRVVRADGQTRWVEFQLVPLAPSTASQVLTAVYLTDRTRLHLQARAARVRLAGADLALGQAGAVVVVTDVEGRVLYWSPGTSPFLAPDASGRHLGAALGMPVAALDALSHRALNGEVVREAKMFTEPTRDQLQPQLSVTVIGLDSSSEAPSDSGGPAITQLAWVLVRTPPAMATMTSPATERELQQILPYIEGTLTLIDETGRTLATSSGIAEEAVLGFPKSAWEAGLNVFDLVDSADQTRVGQAFERLLAAPGSKVSGEFRARTADGRTVHVEGWAVNLLHVADVAGILVVTRDISVRKRTEAFLNDRADILHEIASAAPLEVTMRPLVDLASRHLTGAAAALVQHNGETAGDGPTFTSRTFPFESVQPLLDALGMAAPTELHVLNTLDSLREVPEVQVGLQVGGYRGIVVVPVLSTMAEAESGCHVGLGALVCVFQAGHLPDAAGIGLLREVADLAALAIEREQAEKGLAHQALHDELTGLANRHLLLDRLEQALNRAKRRGRHLALMFLDLDRFKTINDTLGHDVGDQLLRQFAERLRLLVRPEDTVARFGGDEFVVLVEHVIDEQEAAQIADRLESAMNEPFQIDGQSLAVTASVGIAIGEGDDQPATLLRNADVAMYRAKELGRNRTEIYDTRLERHLADRTQLGLDLRAALVEGHLRLVYQPIVDLRTGQTRMVEALLRWDHPQHGRLMPLDFLDAAEDSGQGLELGAWVIERGLTDVAAFARGMARTATSSGARAPKLCINLSARQLAHPELVARVELALARHHFVPDELTIDVPEKALSTAGAMTLHNLENLHQLGVSIAIDDVGAGANTTLLGILERVPADLLKVDPSVIAAMGGNERGTGDRRESLQRSMAAGLLGLGRGLGLAVVAEGVDNPRRLQQLRQLGFDLAQGHAVGAPVDAEQMLKLLQS